jgi:putative PIN family toxin of toxin-antitoxin system
VVLDTTVLVSAWLKPFAGGASYDLLQLAGEGAFDLYLSADILGETAGVLLTRQRIRRRYEYSDADAEAYCRDLARLASIVRVPAMRGVVRDPNDDKIIACAMAARADYLVTRDKDLLSLAQHAGTAIVTPEAFLRMLRASGSGQQ